MKRLCRYAWPGNVRELRNMVERLCIMYPTEVITPELLPREICGSGPVREANLTVDILV